MMNGESEWVCESAQRWAAEKALIPEARSLGSPFVSMPRREIAAAITKSGVGAKEAMRLWETAVACDGRSSAHPMMLGYVPSAPTVEAIACDWMATAACQNAPMRVAAPGMVDAEKAVIDWLAKTVGNFSSSSNASGCFVSGGTLGTLSALYAAREAFRRGPKSPHRQNDAVSLRDDPSEEEEDKTPAKKKRKIVSPNFKKLAVVASKEAHTCVAHAARILDVDLRVVEQKDWNGATLTRLLQNDDVFAVVASAGTTNTGRVEDLRGLGQACAAKEGVWFHVDGAYGLGAAVSKKRRPLFDGIELADSFVVDCHKWLAGPYDAAALVYKNASAAVAANAHDAPFFKTLTKTTYDPCDYAIHLSRRPRGVPIWFSLAARGTSRYEADVEATFAVAETVRDFIQASNFLRFISLNLTVLIFAVPALPESSLRRWCQITWRNGDLFCQPTFLPDGDCVLRLCFVNPATDPAAVIKVLATLEYFFLDEKDTYSSSDDDDDDAGSETLPSRKG